MKKMRFLSVALLSVLAIGALTGCNDDKDSAVTISVDNAATVVVGETLELPYTVTPEKAKIEVLNDHEEYVTAEAEDGVLSLTGVAEGSATITLAGTYKKYTEANVNISVDVISEATKDTEPGVPDTGDDGGDDDGGDGGDTGTSGIVALKEGDEATAVADPGNMYVWADHYDGVEIKLNEAYLDTESALYHIDYEVDTVNSSAEPVWYALQASLQLTEEELLSWGLADGDEYTISFSITSTVAGTITINDVEVAIEQAGVAQEITITSAYRVGAVRAGAEEGDGNRATFWLVAGAQSTKTFLGDAVLEFSGITFAKTETSDTTEAITASGLSNVNGVDGETDGKMHYWANSATVKEATHYLTDDTYVIDYSNATGDWWGFQIFWMLDASQLEEYGLTEGDMYSLTFNLSSSVAGTIQVATETIDISVGENEISVMGTVASTSTERCTFHIWMGADGSGLIDAAKVEISKIVFEKYEVPSIWEHEYSVDLANATPASPFAEEGSVPKDGKFYYWNDQGWCGSNVTVETFGYDETQSGFVIKYSSTGSCWYGFQLWFDFPDGSTEGEAFYAASAYEIELHMTSSVAGEITIHHEAAEYNIVAGENTIIDDIAGTSGTTFCIAFGAEHLDEGGVEGGASTMISTGEFVITELTFRF